jgi:hypothetical protein
MADRAIDPSRYRQPMDATINGDAGIEAARQRVEAVLERLRHVNLQVVVVAAPDATRIAARERAAAAAAAAGRAALLLEASAAAREGTLRSFSLGGFSGTWAATEMSASVTNATDRVAAAAAFEEAAIAAVVEDLVGDETLEDLRATANELDRSTALPAPGVLAGVTSRAGVASRGPALILVQVSVVALAGVVALAFGTAVAFIVLIGGLAAIARLSKR